MSYDVGILSTILTNVLKTHVRKNELKEILHLVLSGNVVMKTHLEELENNIEDSIKVLVSVKDKVLYEIFDSSVCYTGYFIYSGYKKDRVIFMGGDGLNALSDPITYKVYNDVLMEVSKSDFLSNWNAPVSFEINFSIKRVLWVILNVGVTLRRGHYLTLM